MVRGRVADQAGTASYSGLTASTWNVDVEEWIVGDAAAPGRIVVTSLPRSCGDEADSMADAAGGADVILFMRAVDEGWETLTPFQGVVPAENGGVPASWPAER